MATAKIKKSATHVVAIIEKRHYASDGERQSPPPKEQYFSLGDWNNFCQHGPGQGWYLVKIVEKPDNADLNTYIKVSPDASEDIKKAAADAIAAAKKVQQKQ